MSEAKGLARGMMAESATLKESPLLIGRIVIADHSPNGASCSTRAPGGRRLIESRDNEARALSVAAQWMQATPWRASPDPAQPDK
jgi:hypothetical protein